MPPLAVSPDAAGSRTGDRSTGSASPIKEETRRTPCDRVCKRTGPKSSQSAN
ncbi:MAG: hypothetical protein AB4352_01600 [Hormoscilla sp.]